MIWLALYLIGVLSATYPLAAMALDDILSGFKPEPADVAVCAALGLLLALLWPVLLVGVLVFRGSRRLWGRLLSDRERVDA